MNLCIRITWFFLTVFIFATDAVTAATAQNIKCMGCHGQTEFLKASTSRAYIDPVKFDSTTHSIIGCVSCHDKVSPAHPIDGYIPPKATCRECHTPVFDEYAKNLHASKAECNDCHDPHEVKLPEFMSGYDINSKCAKCHDSRKTVQKHSNWLPQAELHIDSLLCITCHTGSKNYVIIMTIETRQQEKGNNFKTATYQELSELAASGEVSTLIDTNADNLVSLTELREFNRNLRGRNMRLWGMMTPEVVTHSYSILENRWDCSFCHASGPKAMQKSFVAFPDGKGGYSRVAVEKGAILDILYGTPDFYMLGTTRSTPLNIIGGLIVAAGLSVALGHGFFRFITRRNREESDHEA
ncbi:MAG: cytochrome c3 family protein [Desulfuromonadaceae bacterium]|nr:cytochrome c3 family protein [Desulfuromonadaceae bacterium]MDD2855571.1 cytochrome c3 family protein [Desulfuromonadaceae bacterium]